MEVCGPTMNGETSILLFGEISSKNLLTFLQQDKSNYNKLNIL